MAEALCGLELILRGVAERHRAAYVAGARCAVAIRGYRAAASRNSREPQRHLAPALLSANWIARPGSRPAYPCDSCESCDSSHDEAQSISTHAVSLILSSGRPRRG